MDYFRVELDDELRPLIITICSRVGRASTLPDSFDIDLEPARTPTALGGNQALMGRRSRNFADSDDVAGLDAVGRGCPRASDRQRSRSR